MRDQVRRLAWVKDASVQKVFPSGLRITVVERVPFALLERDGLRLANKVGYDPRALSTFLTRLTERNKSATVKQGLSRRTPR